MSKHVCVAGGAGFLGSHLIGRLLKRTDVSKIVVVDNLWTGLVKNVFQYIDPRIVFEYSDIETLTGSAIFDEVYHLASPASPPWYMADPARTISANVGGALRLLDLLKQGGKFCYTSSSEVYGDPKVTPQPESYLGSVDCTGPRAAYDEGKRCTEALLFNIKRTSGLDLRVVRPFNVYGPSTRADDGRAVSNFISRALSGRPMTIHGRGLQTRSWGYVDDILDAFEQYFWLSDTDHPGPINIGNDEEISVLEVAQYISNLVPGAEIEFGDPVPQDPTNRRPDLSLAKSILPNWNCETDYRSGVIKTLDWFRLNAEHGCASNADLQGRGQAVQSTSPALATVA
jgi:nucleoside-diphosphate-sugar epimerase